VGETGQVLQREVDLDRYVLTLICSQVGFGLHCTFGLDTTSLTNTMYVPRSAFHSCYCRALPLGDMIEDAPFTIVTRTDALTTRESIQCSSTVTASMSTYK
jgi:hypothetical protein